MVTIARSRVLSFTVALCAALSVAACSNDKDLADASGFGAGGAGGGAYGAGAGTPGSAQDFVVNIGDRVFFESDSTDLTPTATATLDKQAAWLQRYPRYTFLIEGHADERGTREYNFSLGARRAQAVNDYLASRGIASSRIRTVSYGKERPVAVCNDISCWSQNRRAVTVLDRGAGS
ncbi:Peptidoglycan-associated lipoprotein [Methylobacterium adhaesivum]|jgi:peptidoglycan-associated lipoprotein|uniref:Peptidoglycan-associated lipoprotein n=1 Tax=Methylobacterium adhaesivum TaxID=333297 RepID=A0ABT8BH83_9HYPH|nr:peptidoglycan-associated lipoprotein Pal [Methylobacterium adhaesivum]MDN3590529.1 peptidoglycan-associated lipoprotein Pal [Methylobacterium adhaesivum]GJD31351.1 Peptidoglycan-associated lipoprotein [Methylobacterium adhaesivum]